MAENILEIYNLSKSYTNNAGTKFIVLEDLNLKIESFDTKGSFVSILAPFGSGKTTLLKIIAGLESFEGEVKIAGNTVTKQPTGEIIYIPEKPNSFSWLNLKENIEIASNLYKKKDKKISYDVDELISSVGLGGYEDFFPTLTNSGFSLRIAIARALTFNPQIILLDDVLRNLDGETRLELIDTLRNLIATFRITFIMAATNISDALLLSNKIFLMRNNPGKIIKEIDVPTLQIAYNSEIITRLKNEIEEAFKSQNMLNSVLISL